MRLWHYKLIGRLPRQQLLGQHRECCALRGNGWGKKHSTVDYVFNYHPHLLYLYHLHVMFEMKHRGYDYEEKWNDPFYRGKNCNPWNRNWYLEKLIDVHVINYPEHDADYYDECIENLRNKGVII
jgi:uncharacterized protein (TIGR02328 family)